MILSSLSLIIIINLVARNSYYQLRQLRVVSRSLTHQSTLTVADTFATSRIDYCYTLLAALCLGWTEFCVRLPVLLGRCPNFLPSLPTCTCATGYTAYISVDTVSYHCSVGLPLCPSLGPYYMYFCDLCCPVSVSQRVGCCVLLRVVSFWSLWPV